MMLLIRAILAAPIASRHPIHLDSVIMQCHPDVHGVYLSRSDPLPSAPPLPIVSLRYKGESLYLATAGVSPQARLGRESMVARPDAVDIEWREGAWNPSSGPGRAYCLPVCTIEASCMEWLVLGRWQGLKGLLRRVTHLGGQRRHGYGRVLRWEHEDQEHISPVHTLMTSDGRAARHLPASWCVDPDHFDCGPVRPPYWHPGTVCRRIYAGSPCVLRRAVVEEMKGVI